MGTGPNVIFIGIGIRIVIGAALPPCMLQAIHLNIGIRKKIGQLVGTSRQWRYLGTSTSHCSAPIPWKGPGTSH